jgi:hypothetical protein
METLQRMVSRQLTDLSQKRHSQRLKADEPLTFPKGHSFGHFEVINEREFDSSLAFSSPLHMLDVEQSAKSTPKLHSSASVGSLTSSSQSSVFNDYHYSGEGSDFSNDSAALEHSGKQSSSFQQKFKKVHSMSNAIRDRFSSDLLKSSGNALKMKENGAESRTPLPENANQMSKLKKQARAIDVRGKLSRKNMSSDNQNLLLFEEVENEND